MRRYSMKKIYVIIFTFLVTTMIVFGGKYNSQGDCRTTPQTRRCSLIVDEWEQTSPCELVIGNLGRILPLSGNYRHPFLSGECGLAEFDPPWQCFWVFDVECGGTKAVAADSAE
jgi:hypothetical protein